MTTKQSPTGRTETTTEELEQLLKNLKLRRMLAVYDEPLKVAEKEGTSYSEFIAGLLRSQWHDRQETAVEARMDEVLRQTTPFHNSRLITTLDGGDIRPENIAFDIKKVLFYWATQRDSSL